MYPLSLKRDLSKPIILTIFLYLHLVFLCVNRFSIYVLCCILLLLTSCSPQKSHKIAHKGVIDLRSWDFDRDGNVSLDGEWAFRWKTFLMPGTFPDSSNPISYVSIPGKWNDLIVDEKKLSGTGHATYRLRILTTKTNPILSLKIFDISSSYNLFVNKVLIDSNGHISANQDSMVANFSPKVVSFPIQSDTTELVLHISNAIHCEGGIRSQILLGTQQSVQRSHNLAYMLNLLLTGAMLILFIYHFWMFLLRKKERVYFAFGMVCLVVFLRSVVTNERYLQVCLTGLKAQIGIKLDYLTIVLAGLTAAYFFYTLFPKDFSIKVIKFFLLIAGLETLAILVLNTVELTQQLVWFQLIIIIELAFVTWVSILSTIRKRNDSISFLLSLLLGFFFIINDILYENLIINTAYISHFGLLAGIIVQAHILAKRISQAFNSVEEFSANLETVVEQRTAELKASQAQLIQKEKLASLGELTAGIAHEIQNPLNFVNNFSEVSSELVDEMEEELKVGNADIAIEIAGDLKQNLEKINHHGKRASSIVKGMLEHSRQSTGERELTNINQLADEYLRLAYHGMKAKDNNRVTAQFQAEYELIADENLPLINVVPQDTGRVLLNLINNAFQSPAPQTPDGGATFVKKVTVKTFKIEANENSPFGGWGASVSDNGAGIPTDILPKIFQPFFTTKPTGEGTGLGLSLAYDIVTKGHGGTLEVETKEGEGTTFIVKLPIH
jgi:signal transduction histidine kinase